jgi:hypothetical protein
LFYRQIRRAVAKDAATATLDFVSTSFSQIELRPDIMQVCGAGGIEAENTQTGCRVAANSIGPQDDFACPRRLLRAHQFDAGSSFALGAVKAHGRLSIIADWPDYARMPRHATRDE